MKPTLLAVAALAAALPAQTKTFALPSGAEKVQTKIYDSYLGSAATNMPVHVQTGYATSEAPVAAAKLLSLTLRRNNYYGNNIYASTTDVAVHMSTNAADTKSWSSTFANNEGTNRAQVYGSGGNTKTLNRPAAPYVNNGQQPVPFALKVPFDTPFVFVQSSGKSICVDYYMTKRTHQDTNGREQFIILDADGAATGERVTNGGSWSACKFSNGNYNSGLSYTSGGLTDKGGTWYVSYSSLPASTPVLATISAFGVNNKPHAWPLPLNLGPLGSPTCEWRVGLETGIWIPMTSNTNGQARWPNVTIPAGLGGSSFFDHAVVIDTPTSTNKYGLATTWSSEWQIAKTYEPATVTVYKTKDTTPPATSGFVRAYQGSIAQFEY
ncbi:MAG: hypothetical protein R3F30_03200 [Planctomycetota bacterium]